MRKVFAIFVSLGFATSLYIFTSSCFVTTCPLNGSCCNLSTALHSLIGMLWFVAGFAILNTPQLWRAKRAWTVSGIVGIAYFTVLELATRNICPLCTIAHVAGILAILSSR